MTGGSGGGGGGGHCRKGDWLGCVGQGGRAVIRGAMDGGALVGIIVLFFAFLPLPTCAGGRVERVP